MNEKVGRNNPCPCGSGKKYKKCCISKVTENDDDELKELYRFEPGSYGDIGSFMPSLACLKQIRKDEWKYHFVLVKPESVYTDEDEATNEADKDISSSYVIKETGGTDADLAMSLKSKGYLNVDNYNIVGSNKFQA
jgi:hypothetical protein